MYRNVDNNTVNMEHLWYTTNPNENGGSDPLGNSLFNITSLKTLIALGQQEPDIVSNNDKNLVYGTDFNLA